MKESYPRCGFTLIVIRIPENRKRIEKTQVVQGEGADTCVSGSGVLTWSIRPPIRAPHGSPGRHIPRSGTEGFGVSRTPILRSLPAILS